MKLSSYEYYKNSRDLAWRILIDFDISSLPVDVAALCDKLGIRVYTYKNGRRLIDALGLTEYINGNDGFSTVVNGNYIIFYSEDVNSSGRILFTISHELGHILLGHVKGSNIATRWNNQNKQPPDPMETAANVFASRLLAPACVLHEIGISDVDEIMDITGLSHAAAQIRLNRLNTLNQRNKFYLNPLERQVLKQFKGFIEKYK